MDVPALVDTKLVLVIVVSVGTFLLTTTMPITHRAPGENRDFLPICLKMYT